MAQYMPLADPRGAPPSYNQAPLAQPVYVQPAAVPVYYQTAPAGPSNQVLYRSAASERWKNCFQVGACLSCNCCAFAQAEEIRQRKYIEVQANRIEWNDPFHCCFCCIWDRTSVVYYDRAVFEGGATKAGCCNPCCSLCPTCFDICGEAIVLKGSLCSSKQALIPGQFCCCCQNQIMICGFDNAHEIATAINSARSHAIANHTDAPATACMHH